MDNKNDNVAYTRVWMLLALTIKKSYISISGVDAVDRNIALRARRKLTSLLCCLGLLFMTFNHAAAEQARHMVLVAGANAYIPPLTAAEVRKLFLGVVIIKDGQRIEPLLNLTDPFLHEVFLQKVVFMSSENYERQLLARISHVGDPRPQEYSDPWQLISALRTRRGAISYMWAQDARPRLGLKIVQELWQSRQE